MYTEKAAIKQHTVNNNSWKNNINKGYMYSISAGLVSSRSASQIMYINKECSMTWTKEGKKRTNQC